ncbi:MAG TPA: hypothetical protein VIM90_04550 [Arenimonas sp.]
MSHALCETCCYFNSYGATGECRRHAPSEQRPEAVASGTWPTVHRHEWCGDHGQKEAAAVAPDANVEAVRTMLIERSVVGLAKYGTTTERKDLSSRDWLQHLQEELLDAAVYVQALKCSSETT